LGKRFIFLNSKNISR